MGKRLNNQLSTDFEFTFFGEKVKVISDYEKFDVNSKLVQLEKISEPKKSFGVYSKLEIIEHINSL
jgi:hypothetical protein